CATDPHRASGCTCADLESTGRGILSVGRLGGRGCSATCASEKDRARHRSIDENQLQIPSMRRALRPVCAPGVAVVVFITACDSPTGPASTQITPDSIQSELIAAYDAGLEALNG